MRFLSLALVVIWGAVSVNATAGHAALAARRHDSLARSFSSLVSRANDGNKKCPKRSHKPKPAKTKAASKPKSTNKATSNSFIGGNNNAAGVVHVKSTCGNIGASRKSSAVSGPMGSIDWLNCGIHDSGGWRPPYISVKDLITVPLAQAIQSGSSPFKACAKFVHLFEKHAARNGLPSIMLASFALQESSCNPNTVGGGGEQGLMQITKDKCGGAPGGNCREPDFNIGTAAKFFAKTLESNDGNVVVSIGQYNGWHPGLTIKGATAAKHGPCCRCQNNLDYLHQFLNGWMQNIDAYRQRMGKYFNLDDCDH